MKRNLIFAVGLAVLCWLAYHNALRNDFLIDDHWLIFEDPHRNNLQFIPTHFIPDFKKFSHVEQASGNVYYRPMNHIFPLIQHLVFGRNPFGYHVVNLILLYLCGLSLALLVFRLWSNKALAMIVSVLFCVHPLNGIMVNYITAGFFSIQLLGMIWAIIGFLTALEKEKRIYLFLSILAMAVALLCHETSLIFPLYLVGTLYFLKDYSWAKSIRASLPYLGVTVAYFIFRFYFASLQTSVLDKVALHHLTIPQYVATVTKLFSWYFSKLIFPSEIIFIWVITPLREGWVLWFVTGIVSLFFLIVCLVYGKRKSSVIGLSLFWLMAGFLPVLLACLYQPAKGIIFEPHWVFFPSIGFFVLASYGLLNLRRFFSREFVIVLGVLGIGFLVVASRISNELWRNDKIYAHHWLAQIPEYKDAFYCLGFAYFKEGEFVQAREYFRKAIAGRFSDWQIYLNLGLMDYEENRIEAAQNNFEKAEQLFPSSAVVQNNRGLVCLKNLHQDSAKEYFLNAIRYNPFLLEPRLNLASVYRSEKKYDEALNLYQENLRINPKDKNTLTLLFTLYLDFKDFSKATQIGMRLFKLDLSAAESTSLGSLLGSNNLNELAYAFFMKAYQADSSFKDVYLELGKWYGNRGQMKIAKELWQEGSTLDPQDQRFFECLKQAENFLQKNSP